MPVLLRYEGGDQRWYFSGRWWEIGIHFSCASTAFRMCLVFLSHEDHDRYVCLLVFRFENGSCLGELVNDLDQTLVVLY